MALTILHFQQGIAQIFKIGIEVLHDTRELKGISAELKLLAINGIVHAAKIGNNEGRSLITLSGFLSELPVQIAPDLEELEVRTGNLADNITATSMAVRRLMQFSVALEKLLNLTFKEMNSSFSSSNFDLLNVRVLEKIHQSPALYKASVEQMINIRKLADKNIYLLNIINKNFSDIQSLINNIRVKIDRARRNGLIADYMGSNIMIESSYLQGDKKNFNSLVNNIKELVGRLDKRLYHVSEKLSMSLNLLTKIMIK